ARSNRVGARSIGRPEHSLVRLSHGCCPRRAARARSVIGTASYGTVAHPRGSESSPTAAKPVIDAPIQVAKASVAAAPSTIIRVKPMNTIGHAPIQATHVAARAQRYRV